MQVYLFSAGFQSDELTDLWNRLCQTFPKIQKLESLEKLTAQAVRPAPTSSDELSYVVYPIQAASSSLEPVIKIIEKERAGIFYIFVSSEISTSDYKRLLRSGRADWVSLQGAPQEILDIISRWDSAKPTPVKTERAKLAIAAFVASGGGVGNTTLALETAVQLKLDKRTRARRICFLDLDMQTSNVCDYLDIEPRLRMEEIASDPDRLDAQLFDLSVSQHSSGLDVLASPRSRRASMDLSIAALDALFRMISTRYELLLIDLPPLWFGWTAQVISACDAAVVTGFNNVPSLRQVGETLEAVREAERVPRQLLVGLNRCEAQLFGGIAYRRHVKKVLGDEKVLYVRDDSAAASHSINTGVPIAMAMPSGKITKDIRPFVVSLAAIGPAELGAAA